MKRLFEREVVVARTSKTEQHNHNQNIISEVNCGENDTERDEIVEIFVGKDQQLQRLL